MGDILHALPAVTALRQAHPNWVIDWVVEPRWQALLTAPGNPRRGPARPLVDRISLADTKAWRKQPFSLDTIYAVVLLRQQLRYSGYNAAIDFQGALRSALIGNFTGCRRHIGEAAPREYIARWIFDERVRTHGAHVIEQDVELACAIAGDSLRPVTPMLPIDFAAELWCDNLLAHAAGMPIALISPGAGWGAKRWPPACYASVAQGLIDRGFHVLVNCGPGEEPLAAFITQMTNGVARTLTPTLDQLIAVTRRITLCVAGDTGPLHLACALRRPVVGIYGPTDPSRNGPFGTRSRVLRSPDSVRDHSRRPEPEPGLLTIQPSEVLEAADELLAEGRVL
jgi:heptosyltransferase-1